MLEITAVPPVCVKVPLKKVRFEEARKASFKLSAAPESRRIRSRVALELSENVAGPRRSTFAARKAEEWQASDPLVPMMRFDWTTSGTSSPAQFRSSWLAELVGASMIRLLTEREAGKLAVVF